jgi:hypothetical protein
VELNAIPHLVKLLSSSCIASTQSESLSASSTLYDSIEDTKSNIHKNEQLEIYWLPPYECHREWSSRVDLVELLGELLGVAVFVPVLLDHLPCLYHYHIPLDHCPPLEVSHLLDLHHLELGPHLELVEMLDWKMTVDLVLMEALWIP